MTILDDYVAGGTGYEGFEAELKDFCKNTVVYRVTNCGFTLMSFKRSMNKLYEFYGLNKDAIHDFNNGKTDLHTYCIKANNAEDEALLSEVKRTSGMILVYGNQLSMFVSRNAVSQLAANAGATGLSRRHSLCRSLYLAEGLFAPDKNSYGDRLAESVLVCRTQRVPATNPTAVRKVFAIMGKNYNYTSLNTAKEVIDHILAEGHPLGCPEVKEWSFTHEKMQVHLEFPALSVRYEDGQGMQDVIIPGFTITDSDTGHSSFCVNLTFRIGGCPKRVILDGRQWMHTASINLDEVYLFLYKEFMPRLDGLQSSLEKKQGNMVTFSKDNFRCWEKALHIVGMIGKKNEMKLAEMFFGQFESDSEHSEYEMVRFFIVSGSKLDLLPYAADNFALAGGKAPFVEDGQVVTPWED